MKHFQRAALLIFTILAGGVAGQSDSTAPRGYLDIQMEPEVQSLLENYVRAKRHNGHLIGYRVQIYNGRKNETLKKRSEFLSVFPGIEPYTLYDAPEYKLQVGDFRTRLEAERFLREVVREFGSGFVVKTEIKPPRLEYRMPESER